MVVHFKSIYVGIINNKIWLIGWLGNTVAELPSGQTQVHVAAQCTVTAEFHISCSLNIFPLGLIVFPYLQQPAARLTVGPPSTICSATVHCRHTVVVLVDSSHIRLLMVDLKQSWNQWSVVQDIRIVLGEDVHRAQYQISAMFWIWSECIISGWWEYELVPACLCAWLVWVAAVSQAPAWDHLSTSPALQHSSSVGGNLLTLHQHGESLLARPAPPAACGFSLFQKPSVRWWIYSNVCIREAPDNLDSDIHKMFTASLIHKSRARCSACCGILIWTCLWIIQCWCSSWHLLLPPQKVPTFQIPELSVYIQTKNLQNLYQDNI